MSEQQVSRFLHVFTVRGIAWGEGSQRGAEVEGSSSRSGLKICVTARITETATEKTSAVLPERRSAMWSGLLIVETQNTIKKYT